MLTKLLTIAFDIGDRVRFNKYDAMVLAITIDSNGPTYQVVYFTEDGDQCQASCFAIELELIESANART